MNILAEAGLFIKYLATKLVLFLQSSWETLLAEKESSTKVESNPESGHADESAEELLSLEDLDGMIAQEDPDFVNSLVNIGPDDPNSDIYQEGVESEFTLEDEIRQWKTSTGPRGKLFKVIPALPKYSFKLKMKRIAFRLSLTKWKEQSIAGIKNAGPATLNAIKGAGASVQDGLASFKTWNRNQKLAFLGLLVATGVGGFVIYRATTHRLVPAETDLFMGSLQDWSEHGVQYDPKTGVELFYDSTRVSQNIMQLKKMVTNLKRSENSSVNPMGAFEFYLEGTVSEVLVEVKDREPEITDLFLRTISDVSYDQIASAEGKVALCEKLRKNINGVLTTGKIRRVFIKTVIVKP
jgi:flagellar basal body-associated protein FliL